MKTKLKLPSLDDTMLAVTGAVLCGLGQGFMNHGSQGMDAVGIFYDGIRNTLSLSPDQIGTASYIVCFALSVFLWFAARKYVSFGSIIYIVVYGAFANWGTLLMEWLVPGDGLIARSAVAFLGLALLIVGLSVYIAIDIGVDAFTGVVLWLTDITRKKMGIVKFIFDLSLGVIGFILGGKLGWFTFVAIPVSGPAIARLTKRFQGLYFKHKIKLAAKE